MNQASVVFVGRVARACVCFEVKVFFQSYSHRTHTRTSQHVQVIGENWLLLENLFYPTRHCYGYIVYRFVRFGEFFVFSFVLLAQIEMEQKMATKLKGSIWLSLGKVVSGGREPVVFAWDIKFVFVCSIETDRILDFCFYLFYSASSVLLI